MKKALLIVFLVLIVAVGMAVGGYFFLKPQGILRTPVTVETQPDATPAPVTQVNELPRIQGLFKLVAITPGPFLMGSNNGYDDEKPAHKVTLTKPFYMGATEVTQAQWKMIMGNNPSYFKGDNLPVEQVSWNDCVEFCRKLTEREKANLPPGYEYRLPTEAEWEYCCRAGSTGNYCFGNDEAQLGVYAWYDGNSGMKPHPVGTKKPNAWGLYDMHGNVWEWCHDWYYENYYSSCEEGCCDPRGPSSGSDRVIRGGSWCDRAEDCRSAVRDCYSPGITDDDLGVRLVLAPVLR